MGNRVTVSEQEKPDVETVAPKAKIPFVRVVLLGSSIGRSSLAVRLADNKFSWNITVTIGAYFVLKQIGDVKLQIWHPAGHQAFRDLTRSICRNADAAVFCYDLTDSESWQDAKSWVDEIRRKEPQCKMYFCGTKLDLIQENIKGRQVTSETVRDFVKSLQNDNPASHGLEYGIFETSSKTGEGVHEMFNQIAEDYLKMNSNSVAGISVKK